MDTLIERLKKARNAAKLSQTQLARKVGIAQASIGDLERGKTAQGKHLPAIAKALGVSYEWLAYGEGNINFSRSPSVDSGLRMVPVRSLSDLAKDNPMKKEENKTFCPVSLSQGGYAIVVEGDSMAPRYPNKCTVYIDPELPEDLHGCRVVARFDGRAVFRELQIDGPDTYLMPLNPAYRPITSPDIQVLGVAVAMLLSE